MSKKFFYDRFASQIESLSRVLQRMVGHDETVVSLRCQTADGEHHTCTVTFPFNHDITRKCYVVLRDNGGHTSTFRVEFDTDGAVVMPS